MYCRDRRDQTLPDHLNMVVDSQDAPDNRRQDRPEGVQPQYQQSVQYSLNSPLPKVAGISGRDAAFNILVPYHWGESNTQVSDAEQDPPPAQRPSQNRAAFGKWKSKTIPGFPAVDMPLPPGTTAQDICKSFPNHVNDHVILELMRDGKGAKAIDALIPAPLGKQKAGQSHSKIQLRISTIREAFPNEKFPITTTKRNRPRSAAPQDEETSSDNENAIIATAEVVSSSYRAAASGLSMRRSYRGETHHQDIGELQRHRRREGSMSVSSHKDRSNFATTASPYWSQSTRGAPSPRSEAIGPAAFFTPDVSKPASNPHQTQLLDYQIKEECDKHHHLVFGVYYGSQPLPQPEMKQTILSHCDGSYDAFSSQLQSDTGLALKKAILPNGKSEDSLSYLRRSITQCFQMHPAWRARIDLDCSEDQIHEPMGTAVLQDLFDRLHNWTRYLEARLEVARQIKTHRDLHAKHSSKALIPTTASQRMKMDASCSVTRSSRNTRPFGSRIHPDSNQANQSRVSIPISAQPPSEHSFSRQPGQQAANIDQVVDSRRLNQISGHEDHVMTDAPSTTPIKPRHEFEAYMEEAGEFVNREARAMDLPPVYGKLNPSSALQSFPVQALSLPQIFCIHHLA